MGSITMHKIYVCVCMLSVLSLCNLCAKCIFLSYIEYVHCSNLHHEVFIEANNVHAIKPFPGYWKVNLLPPFHFICFTTGLTPCISWHKNIKYVDLTRSVVSMSKKSKTIMLLLIHWRRYPVMFLRNDQPKPAVRS